METDHGKESRVINAVKTKPQQRHLFPKACERWRRGEFLPPPPSRGRLRHHCWRDVTDGRSRKDRRDDGTTSEADAQPPVIPFQLDSYTNQANLLLTEPADGGIVSCPLGLAAPDPDSKPISDLRPPDTCPGPLSCQSEAEVTSSSKANSPPPPLPHTDLHRDPAGRRHQAINCPIRCLWLRGHFSVDELSSFTFWKEKKKKKNSQ